MTINHPAKIIFAGGGTGGHLFPAIAIANRVKEFTKDKMNIDILFVGTKRGLEYRMRDSLGYPLHLINMRGIARSLTFKNLLVPFIIIIALLKSFMLLNRFNPNLVVGTGGYVCWPVLKAASWKRIPTVLQEQNSFPGVTIRQLAPSASKIFLGFEKAKEFLNTKSEILITGNPVRSDIADGNRQQALKEFNLLDNKKTILVLGGSQGARAVNNAVLKSLQDKKLGEKYQILWQTGKRDYKDVTVEAGNKVSGCSLFPFSQNMPNVYAAADIVIARSGALTLSELTACGLPAILIPYPHAAGDHQRKNATDYVERGMAIMIDENELTKFNIVDKAIELLESDSFDKMKQAIASYNANREKAVDVIANEIISMLSERMG